MDADEAKKNLNAAFDELIASLQKARDAIDQPELMPAPANPRNLAEGYRYLMGFLHSAIERSFTRTPTAPPFGMHSASSTEPPSITPMPCISTHPSTGATAIGSMAMSPITGTGATKNPDPRDVWLPITSSSKPVQAFSPATRAISAN